MTVQDPKNSPAFESASYTRQKKRWDLLDDVWEGTEAIWRGGEEYLPKGPLESIKSHQRRLTRSRFFNAYKETVKGLAGMVTRKPLTLDPGTDPKVRADCDNIDGQGTALPVFFATLVEDGLHHGHFAILVDYPPIDDPKAVTLDVEQQLGLRPYWLHITADQVVNCRTMQEGGRVVLSQISLRTERMVPDGDFGEACQITYKVIKRLGRGPTATVVWEEWEETNNNGIKATAMIGQGSYANITEIPVIPGYVGEKMGWFESDPPLYNVAETNLDQFAVQADHRANLYTSGVAVPIFKDRQNKKSVVGAGPETGFDVGKDGDAWYLETTGASLSASRQEVQDLFVRIASQGISLLAPDTRQAETAEAKSIDEAQKDSKLARGARAVQDAIEQAMVFHAQLRKVKPGRVTVPLALKSLSLDANKIAAYQAAVVAGNLSRQTWWEMLSEAGELPEDFDPEQEKERLANEAMPDTPDIGAGAVLGEDPPVPPKAPAKTNEPEAPALAKAA